MTAWLAAAASIRKWQIAAGEPGIPAKDPPWKLQHHAYHKFWNALPSIQPNEWINNNVSVMTPVSRNLYSGPCNLRPPIQPAEYGLNLKVVLK